MHRLQLLILTLLSAACLNASPKFEAGKRYHIVCRQFTQGCVADGASAGKNTPVYYYSTANKNDESAWIITEESYDCYSIKNAKTGKYVTYDGVRQDSPELRRYVSMTSQKDGNKSLWTLSKDDDGNYVIRNLEQNDHVWDVRVDSYCVGTYSKWDSFGRNQLFFFTDEQGNTVDERQPNDVGNGFNVNAWLNATAESPDGWTFDGASWGDPGFGNYSNGGATVQSPFLERWQANYMGGLSNCTLKQTIKYLPEGNYTLKADVIAVRQGGMASEYGTPAQGVWLFANSQHTACSTGSERPVTYALEVAVGQEGVMDFGLEIANTDANWVACDNFTLIYHGTEEELIAGEKEKVRQELSDFYNEEEIAALINKAGDDFLQLEELRATQKFLIPSDPLAKAAGVITIGGREVIYVPSLDYYLCPLPQKQFGKELTTAIGYTPKEGCSLLSIDRQTVEPDSDFTFSSIQSGGTFQFSITTADGRAIEKTVTFTSLPVVKMYGTFNDNYSDGRISVNETDKPMPQLLSMKAKWRGGITNSSGKHKRNYHVKLKDAEGNKLEQKFFGLRNDNSWILESCQVDMARIRNRTLTDLWNDYSTPPYYIDKEKKALTGSRGQFVELILNGEYRGIYCMTEAMDRKQMKLMKYDEEKGEVHGQLWKSKDWTYATLMGTKPDGHYQPKDYLSNPSKGREMWDQFEVKYPDFEDYGNQTDWTTLYNAVNFVCTASDNDFRSHVAEYFDLPVVMDYYILMETILATDNHGKNMYFGVYDQQTDKRITFGVWDMDATCGQRWSDAYYHWNGMRPDQDYSEYISRNEHGDYNLFRRLRNTNVDDFNMQVRLRYRDLRQSWLATNSILNRFKAYFELFKTGGADQREYARWSYDTDVERLPLNFETEMEYLEDWFTRRMNYLDNTRFKINELPPTGIDDIQLSRNTPKAGIYTIGGQLISTDCSEQTLHALPSGIYLINGKKVAVGK